MQEHIKSITENIQRIYKEAGCDSVVMTVLKKSSSCRIKNRVSASLGLTKSVQWPAKRLWKQNTSFVNLTVILTNMM